MPIRRRSDWKLDQKLEAGLKFKCQSDVVQAQFNQYASFNMMDNAFSFTAGPNHPPNGSFRLILLLFHISFPNLAKNLGLSPNLF